MSDRTPIIAGNWKMYKTNAEATAYLDEFMGLVAAADGVEIVICPSYTSLAEARQITSGSNVRIAAQNMHFEAEGAFTGEVSPPMLQEIGVDDVVLGHSERREFYNENDSDLARKVAVAIESGIRPILCCGETDAEREAGQTRDKLKRQMENGLDSISADQFAAIVVAYEPIWAIGTGKTATPQIAQEAIGFIRETLAAKFGDDAASRVRILYGGSVKPGNISELMAERDIDGALVGGASLAASDFAQIVNFK
ncbi:MAG: triose-phosphate isomerase [Actinobacteria bacterium]|nr:triose-phosphate isomerase [Actinomycetota bacterium]